MGTGLNIKLVISWLDMGLSVKFKLGIEVGSFLSLLTLYVNLMVGWNSFIVLIKSRSSDMECGHNTSMSSMNFL